MSIANVNSIDLYYEDCGSGPPIIFQHGYTSSHEVWGGVIEKMCARTRCVAMDARGAGDSAHPENGYSIEQMAADIVGVADALDIDKFHYVGHSMGGVIGYELGLSHADRISSLALVAPAPADGVAAPRSVHDTMRERWANKERDLIIQTTLAALPRKGAHEGVPGQVDRQLSVSAGHFDDCWNAMVEYRKGDRLGEIKSPTLVLSGAADGLLEANLKDFARLGNATLHVFSRVGHGIPREVPRVFARVLADFHEHGVVNVRTVQAAVAAAALA